MKGGNNMSEHDDSFMNCTCPICGTKFHRKPFHINRFKHCYCSKECANKAKSIAYSGSGDHQYGLKGPLNASWNGGKTISRYGYLYEYIPSHPFADSDGYVFQHRIVAEKFLLTDATSVDVNGKKYLKPELVVHHKNMDRMDNRPENLQIMTKTEHQSYHAKLNQAKRDAKTGRFEKNGSFIKIKRVTETAIIPESKTDGAAGFDLYVDTDKIIEVPPHETVMLWTGIAFSIPKGYFGAIFARSGLSVKDGLRPATCVSVIDSDYRGNVGLPMHNDTNVMKIISPHERVAQIVFQKVYHPKLELVDRLDETERGDNGFGSTGR